MSTYIFLGPSLTLQEAKTILPDAYYLPPVRCGDILRVLRLNPNTIGIIDGYFEKTAAVWHKEILFALEKGVRVVGGSSMGALRASELAAFGMEVVGKIAQDYKENIINDDDDVAILHSTAQSDYLPLTEATVNIRYTVEIAVRGKVIDDQHACLILESAKQLYYQERTLEKAIHIALTQGAMQSQMDNFKTWIKNHHTIDLKKEDAILVLKNISNHQPHLKNTHFKVNKPAFFRALQKNIQCRPFHHYFEWLPMQEKIAMASRYLGSAYRLTKRLAYILADCYGLAKNKNIQLTQEDILKTAQKYGVEESRESEKTEFISRMAKINCLLVQEEKITDIKTSPKDYLLHLMRLSGDYVKYKNSANSLKTFQQDHPLKFQVMSCFSYYWWFIERQFLRLKLIPTQKSFQEYSDKFRLTHKLYTPQLTEQWLNENNLVWEEYQYLISANIRLSEIVIQNNVDILRDFTDDESHWWFLDAMYLTGVYEEAKQLLKDSHKLEAATEKIKRENADLKTYLYSLDFSNEEDFTNWLQMLKNSPCHTVTALSTDSSKIVQC